MAYVKRRKTRVIQPLSLFQAILNGCQKNVGHSFIPHSYNRLARITLFLHWTVLKIAAESVITFSSHQIHRHGCVGVCDKILCACHAKLGLVIRAAFSCPLNPSVVLSHFADVLPPCLYQICSICRRKQLKAAHLLATTFLRAVEIVEFRCSHLCRRRETLAAGDS